MGSAALTLPDLGETPEQLAYRAGRLAYSAAAEALSAVDPYQAPEHLRPGLQAGLDLSHPAPLLADETAAEAA